MFIHRGESTRKKSFMSLSDQSKNKVSAKGHEEVNEGNKRHCFTATTFDSLSFNIQLW